MAKTITSERLEQAMSKLSEGSAADAIREAHPDAGKDPVRLARGNLQAQPIPKRPQMIQRHSGGNEGGVRLKYNATFPWAGGGEFGSKRFRQFRPALGDRFTLSASDGYMVGAALASGIDDVTDHYADSVERKLDALL